MIVYDRLWITLKKKNISQYALIKDYGIDKAQLQRLRKNMVVKTVILNRLCSILDCKIEDIMEFGFQWQIILYNTVMYNGNCSLFIIVRMGIHITWCAMSCPSCMSDTNCSGHSCSRMCQFFQYLQSSYSLGDLNLLAIKNSHTC